MRNIFTIILCLLSLSCTYAGQINIVFRYDDVRLQNDSINEKIVRIFLQHHIPLVLGVIPYDANEHPVIDPKSSFLASLKEAVKKGEVEIALHGLNHQQITPYGEFKGLSYEEQNRRIQKGKHFLDSVFNYKVATYIPPWNAHDNNTVKALNKNGITIVSSSIYDVWAETAYYPMTTSDFREIEGLVLNNQLFGGMGVVMMHSYDFTGRKSFEEFDKTLTLLQNNLSVHFYTFREMKRQGIFINTVQSDDFMRQNLLSKMIHQKGIFISKRDILTIKSINAFLYLLLFYLVYLISQYFILKKHRINSIQIVTLTVAGLLVFFATWFYWLGPLKLALCTILFALALTWIFRLFKVYDFVITIQIKKKDN